MTVANAIKKLARYGEVKHPTSMQYQTRIGDYIVSFLSNGEDRPDNTITCCHTQRVTEKADYNSDYFPGSFWDNLTQAIDAATRWEQEKKYVQP